jgi:hypothetical protein
MAKALAALVTVFFVMSLACSPKEPTPNADKVRSSANQNAADSGGEERLGLSEPKRKEICEEIYSIRTQASLEANTKYPMVVQGERPNPARMMERGRKRAELMREVIEKSMTRLANQHHLSRAQLTEIEEEGIDKNWIKRPTLTPEYK